MMNKTLILIAIMGMMMVPAVSMAGGHGEQSVDRQVQGLDHLALAKQQEQDAQDIQMRIKKLEDRLADLSHKPYFDPKGFGRSQSRLLLTKLEGELIKLQERIAWHYSQAGSQEKAYTEVRQDRHS